MPHRRETCLVTGGAGFIGSHLVARLLEEGHSVVILDDLSTGRRKNVPGNVPLISMRLGARSDLRPLDSFGVTIVCHLGGQSSGEGSFLDPAGDLDSNAGGTLALLLWARQARVRKIILASTMGVYGERTGAADEAVECTPASFYGVSKLAAERYVSLFGRQGLAYTIFRMFNVYGPGQDLTNQRHGMVGIYLSYLLRGAAIEVKGSLDRVRDLIYVGDVVEAWARSLEVPASDGQTLNLGSGVPSRVGDLIDRLIRCCGHDPGSYPVRSAPPTPGDVQGFWADIGRLRRVLAWSPRWMLEDGLARMVASYQVGAEDTAA
ncbi:MAG: NAD-dependent epimerase/dehydratase family protein [Nitrospirae bacterium]|nr:NAD-dependent epimerase/dehydratase family protein [Nitrospirota bacterium]